MEQNIERQMLPLGARVTSEELMSYQARRRAGDGTPAEPLREELDGDQF